MNEENEKNQITFGMIPLADDVRRKILGTLKEEGFTEEQLNRMAFERVWKLYIDSFTEAICSQISELSRSMEANPQFASSLNPKLKKINHELQKLVDSLEKELHEKERKEEKSNE
jgi:hypothetical protein